MEANIEILGAKTEGNKITELTLNGDWVLDGAGGEQIEYTDFTSITPNKLPVGMKLVTTELKDDGEWGMAKIYTFTLTDEGPEKYYLIDISRHNIQTYGYTLNVGYNTRCYAYEVDEKDPHVVYAIYTDKDYTNLVGIMYLPYNLESGLENA